MEEKRFYYATVQNLYEELFPKVDREKKILSKEKKVYVAEDGSIIFCKDFLPEIELVDCMEQYTILYSDRVVKPYVKLPKYFSLPYIRIYRYVTYLSYYLFKKRRDKNFTYFMLEENVKSLSKRILEKFKEYYSESEELTKVCEVDLEHPLIEQNLMLQIFPFILLFLRADAVFFFSSEDSKQLYESLINESYQKEKIKENLLSSLNLIKKGQDIIQKENHLDTILEKLSFCNFKHSGEFIETDMIHIAFRLLSSILRIIYFLKLSLDKDFQEFLYRVAFAAFISTYNPYFHKLKYFYAKKKENPDSVKIPDLGNFFLYRFLNLIMSYLKNPKLSVEILAGGDLHVLAIAEDEDVKKIFKNLIVNPILPFDTRAVDLLEFESILRMSKSYLNLYSTENELLKVVLYKSSLEKFYKAKLSARKVKYKADPKKMLSDIMLYEKISLKCSGNKLHYETVFSYSEGKDISNYKKYSDKTAIVLAEGRFSDFKNLEEYRKVKVTDERFEYWFEETGPDKIEEVKEEQSENYTHLEEKNVKNENSIKFDVEKYLEKEETTLTLLRAILKRSYVFNFIKGGENMEEFEYENMEEINEEVYKDLIQSFENQAGKVTDPMEKLLLLKEEENRLLEELNKKLEKLIQIVTEK